MKISVDKNKCVSCGLCVSSCPECFELKDGVSTVKEGADKCDKCDLRQVATDCPAEAISVED